jgi:sodium-independent sulfate anion transporter 11
MACFVYTIFGSWKDVPVGPTAIAAILTRETLQKAHLGPDFAVLLCFISGCVSLIMGILQLGKIKKSNSVYNIDITQMTIHNCQD